MVQKNLPMTDKQVANWEKDFEKRMNKLLEPQDKSFMLVLYIVFLIYFVAFFCEVTQ